MKVLWFTNSSVDYHEFINGYNGGGWMTSLKKNIDKEKYIELGISFLMKDSVFKKKIINTTYYPVCVQSSFKDKIVAKVKYFGRLKERYKNTDAQYLKKFLEVISDFNPDIIHIWGTEKNFGLICKYVKVPVIIHLQGIINPYLNAFFPQSISIKDYAFKDGHYPLNISKNIREYEGWKYIAKREKEIFKQCKYFMGRTEWDRILTEIYSENAKYFHCDETLRDEFYTNKKWQPQSSSKFKVITTISSPLYKGGDLLLKTARLLKNEMKLDFEWYVFGIDNLKFQEDLLGIKAVDVNLNLKGIATSEILQMQLLSANVFVHPSYIDNSPNSVCEAQITGVPVIACNVGGISSLIKNNETGLLVPSNDPYSLAYKIKELCVSKLKAEKISKKAVIVATKRHNSKSILLNLVSIYNKLYANQIS
jgi:glycosyltransferase involved in cell wall biosynthesis